MMALGRVASVRGAETMVMDGQLGKFHGPCAWDDGIFSCDGFNKPRQLALVAERRKVMIVFLNIHALDHGPIDAPCRAARNNPRPRDSTAPAHCDHGTRYLALKYSLAWR